MERKVTRLVSIEFQMPLGHSGRRAHLAEAGRNANFYSLKTTRHS